MSSRPSAKNKAEADQAGRGDVDISLPVIRDRRQNSNGRDEKSQRRTFRFVLRKTEEKYQRGHDEYASAQSDHPADGSSSQAEEDECEVKEHTSILQPEGRFRKDAVQEKGTSRRFAPVEFAAK